MLPFSPFFIPGRSTKLEISMEGGERERGNPSSLPLPLLEGKRRREPVRDAGNAMGRGANTGSKRIIKRRGLSHPPSPVHRGDQLCRIPVSLIEIYREPARCV